MLPNINIYRKNIENLLSINQIQIQSSEAKWKQMTIMKKVLDNSPIFQIQNSQIQQTMFCILLLKKSLTHFPISKEISIMIGLNGIPLSKMISILIQEIFLRQLQLSNFITKFLKSSRILIILKLICPNNKYMIVAKNVGMFQIPNLHIVFIST